MTSFNLNGDNLNLQAVGDEVDTPKTGVLVACVEGLEGVCQVVLGRRLSQTGSVVVAATLRAVPRAQQRVGDHQRDVVGILPAGSLHCDGYVSQRDTVVSQPNL